MVYKAVKDVRADEAISSCIMVGQQQSWRKMYPTYQSEELEAYQSNQFPCAEPIRKEYENETLILGHN